MIVLKLENLDKIMKEGYNCRPLLRQVHQQRNIFYVILFLYQYFKIIDINFKLKKKSTDFKND